MLTDAPRREPVAALHHSRLTGARGERLVANDPEIGIADSYRRSHNPVCGRLTRAAF